MQQKSVIDASSRNLLPDFQELYRYRDLFYTLAWRDFRVRYAQTSIGLLWALLQPVATLLILSLVFGRFVGVETPVPHLLFTVAGTSIWTYFSYVMTNSGNSIITSQAMIKKIYFPRLIVPLSKAVVGFIDFGISILIMIALFLYYGIAPASTIVTAPIFVLFGIVASLSVGIWLSALTVRYRDFQHIVPFMVQLGMYLTPIAYPAEFAVTRLPSWASTIYFLNPMAGVVQGFRWSVFGGEPPGELMYLSFVVIIILLVSGIFYFNRVADEMADFV